MREKKEELKPLLQLTGSNQLFPRFSSALIHPGQSPHFYAKTKGPEDGSRNAGMHPQQQECYTVNTVTPSPFQGAPRRSSMMTAGLGNSLRVSSIKKYFWVINFWE